jgi:dolichyl-diphosphooligosaccharide--protein glycosyltransferase
LPPWPLSQYEEEYRPGGAGALKRFLKSLAFWMVPEPVVKICKKHEVYQAKIPGLRFLRAGAAAYAVYYSFNFSKTYIKETLKHAESYADQLSNPQLMWMAKLRSGEKVLVDDYYAGYKWVEANTPADSRVMAWWDYGYQITGVANRTSIADGNTWNHEHIATLGYMLTSPEKRAHKYIRHMADYVLVWAGGGGDDMAKSPHLARIANSVFPDHCGDHDPKCQQFGFYQGGIPTPMMEKSLLYKLVMQGTPNAPKASIDKTLFKEVHTTKYGYMRVYKVMNVSKKSKEYATDPTNRKCDAPGSWYCEGVYPPSLKPLIDKRRNFAQLEDFNRKGGEKSAYTKLTEKQHGEL